MVSARCRNLVTFTITPSPVTTTTLASSANPSVFGQPVTFTATVAPAAASGKVAFYDGTTVKNQPAHPGGVFPMALVPLGWGLWNVFYLWLRQRSHLAIGIHGAIFPFVLSANGGGRFAHALGVVSFGPAAVNLFGACSVPYGFISVGFCCGVAAYYLVWKYIVGFLNGTLRNSLRS